MMSKPDDGLYDVIKRHLPIFDFQRIEMDLRAAGVPDVNFCCSGIEGWIELKATPGWAIVVRPAQAAWIGRRIRHGGRVHLMIRRARTELWLYPGAAIAELADRSMRDVAPAAHWGGGPSRWPWTDVAHFLLTH